MILNDSNHVGKEKLTRCAPPRLEARGGGRRRGKPLLGGLLGTLKPLVAQRAGGIIDRTSPWPCLATHLFFLAWPLPRIDRGAG